MNARVLVTGNRGSEWLPCAIIGRKPAPRSFVENGKPTDWYIVRTCAGRVFSFCNPCCVKV